MNYNPPDPSDNAPDQPVPAPQPVRVALPSAPPYVTYAIIGVTVLVFLLELASRLFLQVDLVIALLAKVNTLIRAGQVWRLITPALVHDDQLPFHILFNMYALFIFGTSLERFFGRGRFLLLYVLSAFSGNVISFLFSSVNSIGASTAIFGLIGAEGVFFYQNRKLFGDQFRRAIGNVIFIAAVNLFLGLSPNIDNWGHVGGLLGGLLFSWFAGPIWEVEGIRPMLHMVDKRPLREVIVGAAMVLFVFGGLAMWGMVR